MRESRAVESRSGEKVVIVFQRNLAGIDVPHTHDYTCDGEGNRATRTVRATGYVTVYAWDHHDRLIGVTEFDDKENILSEVKHDAS